MENTLLQKQRQQSVLVYVYWIAISVVLAVVTTMLLAPIAHAAESDLFAKIAEIVGGLFDKIIAISSLVAGFAIIIAVMLKIISKDQRVNEEATKWIKRIILGWVVINGLSFFLSEARSWVSGAGTTAAEIFAS